MQRTCHDPRPEIRPQRPRKGRRVIVFLHGYGADGADLLGLADVLGQYLPGLPPFARRMRPNPAAVILW